MLALKKQTAILWKQSQGREGELAAERRGTQSNNHTELNSANNCWAWKKTLSLRWNHNSGWYTNFSLVRPWSGNTINLTHGKLWYNIFMLYSDSRFVVTYYVEQYKTNVRSQTDLIYMEWSMGIVFVKSSHVILVCSQGQDHWLRISFTHFLLNHGEEELLFSYHIPCGLNF